MKKDGINGNGNGKLVMAVPEKEKALMNKDVIQLFKEVEVFKIKTQEDRNKGAVLAASIKELKKTLEDKRKTLVDPLNKVVKTINGEFKPMSEKLEEAERIVKNEIARDYREQEAIRIKKEMEEKKKLEEELRKREAELKKAEAKNDELQAELIRNRMQQAEMKSEAKIDAVMERKTVTTAFGQTSVRKIWDWELIDISQVPMEFLKIDEAKITTSIRGGAREIKGIRIFQRESVSVR